MEHFRERPGSHPHIRHCTFVHLVALRWGLRLAFPLAGRKGLVKVLHRYSLVHLCAYIIVFLYGHSKNLGDYRPNGKYRTSSCRRGD
jgi:hypothetical protein